MSFTGFVHLRLHSEGRTSYLEMSKGLADSGVEKWTFDTNELTVAYYDRAGNELLVEQVAPPPQT